MFDRSQGEIGNGAIGVGHPEILSKTAAMLIGGNLMLIASAKFQIPFWPVPMTLETFAVLLLGVTYGRKLATATVALFLTEGLTGLPVFAAGGGLAYFLGPTGGYLAGCLVAVVLVACLADSGWRRSPIRLFMALVIGDIVIFASGFLWLSLLIGYADAFSKGVVPFLFGDLVKIVSVALVVIVGQKTLAKRSAGEGGS